MTAEAYAADQTGKREWRARVWWEGRWNTIGCRDNQSDALKSARRVWHSLQGDWLGGTDDTRLPDGKLKTLRELHATDFLPEAFTTDGNEEIIAGPHGGIRECNNWYVTRFRNLTPRRRAEIEAFLESRWYGSREIHSGQLFAVGAGREFLLSMGELIGAHRKMAKKQTEGLPKVAPGGQQNQVGTPPKISDPLPCYGGSGYRVFYDAQRGNWRLMRGHGKARRWAGRYATQTEAEAAAQVQP